MKTSYHKLKGWNIAMFICKSCCRNNCQYFSKCKDFKTAPTECGECLICGKPSRSGLYCVGAMCVKCKGVNRPTECLTPMSSCVYILFQWKKEVMPVPQPITPFEWLRPSPPFCRGEGLFYSLTYRQFSFSSYSASYFPLGLILK